MDYLTKISVSHALDLSADIKTHYVDSFFKKYNQNSVSKYFGIFVTILRSKKDEQKNWPVNTHGCQGNWTNTLENKINKDLLGDLISSTHRAIKDKRSSYFKY